MLGACIGAVAARQCPARWSVKACLACCCCCCCSAAAQQRSPNPRLLRNPAQAEAWAGIPFDPKPTPSRLERELGYVDFRCVLLWSAALCGGEAAAAAAVAAAAMAAAAAAPAVGAAVGGPGSCRQVGRCWPRMLLPPLRRGRGLLQQLIAARRPAPPCRPCRRNEQSSGRASLSGDPAPAAGSPGKSPKKASSQVRTRQRGVLQRLLAQLPLAAGERTPR